MSDKLIVTIENNDEGTNNRAQVSFDFANLYANDVANVLVMLYGMGAAMAHTCNIVKVESKLNTLGAQLTELPFPQQQFNDIFQTVWPGKPLPAATFPLQLSNSGNHFPAPAGTSIVMGRKGNVAGALIGRQGRGRFYLPFITTECVNAAGRLYDSWARYLNALHRGMLVYNYSGAINVDSPAAGVAVPTLNANMAYGQYEIYGNFRTPGNVSVPVQTTQVSTTFSNLRSRRR